MPNLTRTQKKAKRKHERRSRQARDFQIFFTKGYNFARAGATPEEMAKYVQFETLKILGGDWDIKMEKLDDVACKVCGEMFERAYSEDQAVCSYTCHEAAKLLDDDDEGGTLQ